jgi:hypothetical protein
MANSPNPFRVHVRLPVEEAAVRVGAGWSTMPAVFGPPRVRSVRLGGGRTGYAR